MLNFLNNLGLPEIIIIGIVLMLFMGGKKMSSVAKTAGESTKEIKRVKKELEKTKGEINQPESKDDSEE